MVTSFLLRRLGYRPDSAWRKKNDYAQLFDLARCANVVKLSLFFLLYSDSLAAKSTKNTITIKRTPEGKELELLPPRDLFSRFLFGDAGTPVWSLTLEGSAAPRFVIFSN